MGKIDDSQLVALAAGGDAEAFTELVRRYRDMVYGYCYHRTGLFEDARDLAQETFVRAYTRLSQLRDSAKLGAWLRKVAANLCTRWAASRREMVTDQVIEPEQPRQSPRAAVVREALSSLPDNERLAVVMHYVDGLSYADIAGFLEVTPGAVRGRLARGREMLRTEVLRMTRETFDENRLDEKFVIDAVNSALREAMDAYNLLLDKDLSRKKTDEALALIDQAPDSEAEDPVVRADALVTLGIREFVLSERDRAREHWDRARALYEQAGHQDGLMKLRSTMAYDRLMSGDLRAAHRLYSEAGGYWLQRRPDEEGHGATECLSAARALESLGLDTDRGSIVHFLAGISVFVREDSQTICREFAGLGFVDDDYPARVRCVPGPPPDPAPTPLVLMRNEPSVGDKLLFVNFDGRAEEQVMESLSEAITTPAGTFENCAHSVSRIFASEEWEGEPVASRRMWIAPGVGIVRVSYERIGGATDSSELIDYHICTPSDDYLPLVTGNCWKWRWIQGEEEFGFRTEMYKEIVAEEDGKAFALRYSYAVKTR